MDIRIKRSQFLVIMVVLAITIVLVGLDVYQNWGNPDFFSDLIASLAPEFIGSLITFLLIDLVV